MVIRYFGHDGQEARNREHCSLARVLASLIDESSDREMLAPVPLGLVCFRARPEGMDAAALDALNEAILQRVNESGRALLSQTRLNDKFTLRLSVGNIRTTEKHLRQVWELLNEQLRSLK
jgi:aromatic-L-amino-acid decarboxylase